MSIELRITQAAWGDAERIYEWIYGQGAPLSAHRWFNGWLKQLRNLEAFPEGRALAPEDELYLDFAVHQQLFGNFRSIYVVRENRVFVVHVRRASRRPATRQELDMGVDEALDK